MKTQVTILHHDYPARVRDFVEGKIQTLSRFHDRAISMRANLERQSEDHRVELIANVGRGSVLVADAKGEALGPVLEEALDRMARQMKRHHDKVTRDRHRGGRPGHVA
ncbi:MAG: ribosome-associated translation inhibitor RaiA [bacterium]|nr:ribosome-associated translation inhibitor RaiA [bacterium]